MARLWQCGFELGSATSGVEWDTSTGTISIDSSIKRSGNNSLRCNPSAATGFLTHRYQADSATLNAIRAYIYIASAPAAITTIISHEDATTVGLRVRLATDRTLELWSSTAKIGISTPALSLNTWYRVEMEYNDADVTNNGKIYLDGTLYANANANDLAGGGIVKIGVIDSTTADIYFDDIACNDSNFSGNPQEGLPGSGSIVHMLPSAAGDNAQWQAQASGTQGTSVYTNVDEATPDDATTYNKRTTNSPTTTPIDDFNVVSPSSVGIGSSDTVNVVAVGVRAGATNATATGRSIKTRLKSASGGTTTESATTDISVNGWITHSDPVQRVYKVISRLDPTTGVAWTPTGTNSLDNMQIGYQAAVSSTNEIRVSTIWASVDYIPTPAPTSTSDFLQMF